MKNCFKLWKITTILTLKTFCLFVCLFVCLSICVISFHVEIFIQLSPNLVLRPRKRQVKLVYRLCGSYKSGMTFLHNWIYHLKVSISFRLLPILESIYRISKIGKICEEPSRSLGMKYWLLIECITLSAVEKWLRSNFELMIDPFDQIGLKTLLEKYLSWHENS